MLISPTAAATFSKPVRCVNMASRKHVVPLSNISAIVNLAPMYPSTRPRFASRGQIA